MLDSLDPVRRDACERPAPVRDAGAAPGVAADGFGLLVRFENDQARREWGSERVNPWLRVVILMAEAVAHELGGTVPVARIFGEGIYSAGDACDLHPLGIPSCPNAYRERRLAWICTRLCLLFPFGEGEIQTAQLVGGRIRIRVPRNGFRRDAQALADWHLYGVTPGEVKGPRRLAI